MFTIKNKLLILTSLVCVLAFQPTIAVEVPVASGDYIDFRTGAGQVSKINGAPASDLRIDWTITSQAGPFPFHYKYVISGLVVSTPTETRLELDIVDGSGVVASDFTNLSSDFVIQSISSSSVTFVDFPTPETNFTFEFDSKRNPVWGDFLLSEALDERWENASTTVFSDGSTILSPFAGWVPTFGSVAVVLPEPATYLMMGTGVLFVMLLSGKRKQIKQKTSNKLEVS